MRVKRLFCLLLCLLLGMGAIGAQAESGLYEDAVFVGDSVTQGLRAYLKTLGGDAPAGFSGARFLTAQSYMLYVASRKNLLEGHANLFFGGEACTLQKAVKKLQPGWLFVLLGLNDYAGEDVDKHIGYARRLIMLVREVSPDTRIVFQSLTPVTRAFCRKKDYRTLWQDYNTSLAKMCEEENVIYLDIGQDMTDEEGYLKEEFAQDGLCHLNDEGNRAWVEALRRFAEEEREP